MKPESSYFLVALPRDWARWLCNHKTGTWVLHAESLDNTFIVLIGRGPSFRVTKRKLRTLLPSLGPDIGRDSPNMLSERAGVNFAVVGLSLGSYPKSSVIQ